jgi:hypothetical protein
VRPEVHEVTSTTELAGELMATDELMATSELMATRELTATGGLVATHHTARMAAETAPVAAASPTSVGERGRCERET